MAQVELASVAAEPVADERPPALSTSKDSTGSAPKQNEDKYIEDRGKRRACLQKRLPTLLKNAYKLGMHTNANLFMLVSENEPETNETRKTTNKPRKKQKVEMFAFGKFATLVDRPEFQSFLCAAYDIEKKPETSTNPRFGEFLQNLANENYKFESAMYERVCAQKERDHQRMLERLAANPKRTSPNSAKGKSKDMTVDEALALVCDEMNATEEFDFDDLIYGRGSDEEDEIEELEKFTSALKRKHESDDEEELEYPDELPSDYDEEASTSDDDRPDTAPDDEDVGENDQDAKTETAPDPVDVLDTEYEKNRRMIRIQ